MRNILFILLIFTLNLQAAQSAAKEPAKGHCYYIDAIQGNDRNSGLSPKEAWQSIEKVNSMRFTAGDRILFRSGCQWKGELRPQGSGLPGAPICMSKYGKGPLPLISKETLSGVVVLLQDQEQWEISSLHIDGGSEKGEEAAGGIHVQALSAGKVLRHIVISGCTITRNLGTVKLYESCAIWVGVPGWNDSIGLKTGFDDVLIENNFISHSDRNGILVWTTAGEGPNSQFMKGLIPSRHVVVRHNTLEDIGGDGIIILGSVGALVEKNVVRRCCLKTGNPLYGTGYNPSSAAIWLHHCDSCIMQYNAVYDCQRVGNNNDGMAYDFDFNCKHNILQYNYSCNNAGGFLLIMNTAENNIARYNISENDHNHLLFCVGKKDDNNRVYNNTFYSNEGTSYIVPNATFVNNIFMADKEASMSVDRQELGLFENNCYGGNWTNMPDDKRALVANPLLKNPGKGAQKIANLKGYSLTPASPCLGRGTLIENPGGWDFFHHPVSQKKNPDLGAIEHKGKR